MGPGGHLGILGREGQIVLWLESQNSRKQILTVWNEGGGGFSLPTSGILCGEKGKRDLEQSKGKEGELLQVRAGAQAAESVPPWRAVWWAGRRPSLARSALPAEGLGLKARMTRPCPCLHSPGPLLFSASCYLPWLPARSQDLLPSSLPCPLRPEAQGPGRKKEVSDQKAQRKNEAGVNNGERVTWAWLLPCWPHLYMGLVTPT